MFVRILKIDYNLLKSEQTLTITQQSAIELFEWHIGRGKTFFEKS